MPAPPPVSARASRLFGRISRRILPVLLFTYTVNFLDRVNVSFANLSMSRDLGMDPAIYGFAAGLFFLGYFVFEVPSNLALHRLGARLWLTRIALSWAVVSFATGFVQTPAQFCVARFLLGLAEAGLVPGMILYLSAWYPARLRARVMAGLFSAVAIGSILGGPISGAILASADGWLGLPDWRWLFFLEAIPSFAAAVWLWFGLPDRPAAARWLAPRERATLERLLARETPAANPAPASAFTALREPLVWSVVAIAFCQTFGVYGVSFWLPEVLRSGGVTSPATIGWLSVIPWTFGALAMFAFGASSDRRHERRGHLVVAALTGAAGFLLIAASPSLFGDLLGLTLGVAGSLAVCAIVWSVPGRVLSGAQAAVGIAAINAIGNLGGFLSPTIMGAVIQQTGTPAAGQLVPAAALLAGAALAATFRSLNPPAALRPPCDRP